MANYFVINNKFRPYSFDELIKPYQMYGEEYKAQEAALDVAREKEFSPDYLDKDLDKPAYDMYTKATNELKAASDELATRGLSSNLRGRIKTTARDYQNTMKSLTEAQTKLEAERLRRLNLGDSHRFQQSDIRIGDFMNGKTPNQESVNLDKLANDINTEFGRRAASITKDTWDKVFTKDGKVVGGMYDITTEKGLTNAQLDAILSDDRDWKTLVTDNAKLTDREKQDLQRFRDVISRKKSAIDYDKYAPNDQSDIDAAIGLGATAALQQVSHQYHDQPGYSAMLQRSYGAADRLLALQLRYPQYQFDANGKPKTDKDGNIVLSKGWKQDGAGRWIGPSGQIVTDSGKPERKPFIGVKYYSKDGTTSFYKDDAAWNNALTGVAVRSAADLSQNNIDRLAQDLGIIGYASNDDVFNEAIRRGITVTVINHGFDKDANGNKTKIRDNQEMIVRGTKTQNEANAGEAAAGGGGFDPNANPDGEK